MTKLEFLSPEGLRLDGRRPKEIRKFVGRMSVFEQTDGSAYVEQGSTKALASIYGPHNVTSKSNTNYSRCVINCEFSMASFSFGERRRKTKSDRRSQELGLLIQQTFEEAILTNLYPNSQIDIFVQIIQADGGLKCAAINAVALALIDAGVPMKDFVVSCAAGFVENTPIVDMNHLELTAGGPELTLAVLPSSQQIVLCQMESRLHADYMDSVLEVAMKGCEDIYSLLKAIVRNRTEFLAQSICS